MSKIDKPTMIKMYGGVPLITSKYGLLKTALAVNISTPNGGVAEPSATWNVIIIPKWIGSIPAAVAAGRNIGVKTKITTIGSTNIQPIKKKIVTITKTYIALGSGPNTASEIICGTRSKLIKYENT